MTGSTVKVEERHRERVNNPFMSWVCACAKLAPDCPRRERLALAFAEQEQAVTEAVERRVGEECARANASPVEPCWTCGGQPHPSGLTCVCGGSGIHISEVQGLREEVFRLSGESPHVLVRRAREPREGAHPEREAE